MRLRVLLIVLQGMAAATLGAASEAGRPVRLTLAGDVSPVHDPAIIRQGGRYHLFATNRFAQRLLPMFCSPDLRRWTLCGNVFDEVPAWARELEESVEPAPRMGAARRPPAPAP